MKAKEEGRLNEIYLLPDLQAQKLNRLIWLVFIEYSFSVYAVLNTIQIIKFNFCNNPVK